jgi:glutathione peroxidase-family protein
MFLQTHNSFAMSLQTHNTGADIKWNFAKFLISNGETIKRSDPVNPHALHPASPK